MKNGIADLRNHLFAALEALQDVDAPMDVNRARAIADVAQTIINSAKVECEYLSAIGAQPTTRFIPSSQSEAEEPRLRLARPA